MEVVQVLHMNRGVGDSSYANNSLLQRKVISMMKPIRDEAIAKLYSSKIMSKLVIAELGCSSGPNTLLVASELIKKVDEICQKYGNNLPECIQVFLNDLPGNDFNTVFKSLPEFHGKLRKSLKTGVGQCYFCAAPGSFYSRLFPNKSLHFVHSSYSLHWLSQVPRGLENNKGNICVATTSPSWVVREYHKQFQTDFSTFLKCRSEELMNGGCMVLTWLGRKQDHVSSEDSSYIWELLAVALNQMVTKGLIEEEEMNSFNIPFYTPSPAEVHSEVLKEGSFSIDRLEISEIPWNVYDDQTKSNRGVSDNGGYIIAKNIRAVVEPLLIDHFGYTIIDEVFDRYGDIINDRMSKEKLAYTNLTVSLKKIG